MWIATAEQSRRLDQKAAEEYGLAPKILIERAGEAIHEATQQLLPEGGHLTVFCGIGNNGADGFAAARIAKSNGFSVDCLVAAHQPDDLKPDCAEQMFIARMEGIEPIFFGDPRWRKKVDSLGSRDLVIDALLGTGARCNVCGPVREAIQKINHSGVPVLSVDIPSGVLCDTGEELGESIWALRTVVFGLPKPYLFEGIGLEHAGYWSVADIGYPSPLLGSPTTARLVCSDWIANLLPERLRASHKGENGHLLIVAGSERMRGAAVLVALAALRSGIGLVTVASTKSVCDAIAYQVPEAMLLPLPDEGGVLGFEAAEVLLEADVKCHAAVFGPGMSHSQPVLEFLGRVWENWTKPCVIDADALNAISCGLHLPAAECVLTPHPGEMSRLLQCSIAEVQADRFQTVDHAVLKMKQCVLLKGPYSIVAEPGQPMLVNHTGNPGLASGGMGDTLSGIIGALLAQDLPSYCAAGCAMYWHGLAADLCAQKIGPIGYTATDVINAIPQARAKIVTTCLDS